MKFIILFGMFHLYMSISMATATTCDDAYECVGNSIVIKDATHTDDVEANGYKSVYGSDTHIMFLGTAGDVYSRGSFSSYNMRSFHDKDTLCQSYSNYHASGGFSGMNGNYGGDFLTLDGSGVGSLVNSHISTHAGVYCDGAMSCYGSRIIGAGVTYRGSGSRSMQNMRINAFGTMTINLNGYNAGYNTTIICEEGNICNLNCYGTGCFGTYFICDTSVGSSCNIDVTQVVNSLYEPLNDLSDALPVIPSEEEDWVIDIIEIGLLNDAQCDLPISTTFDNSGGSSQNPILSTNGGNICCRGFGSCDYKDISIQNGGNIICDGETSCLDSTINLGDSTTSNVYCDGKQSCDSSEIYSNSNTGINIVYCGGGFSCRLSTIDDVYKLYGSGSQSLREATINGVSNIYLTGSSAAEYSTINSDGVITMNIYMIGHNSASQSTINCQDGDFCNIYCHTPTSCSNVQINAVCTNYDLTCDSTTTGWNCPTITDVRTNCPGYTAIDQLKTYSAAKSYCLSNFGTSLATITSDRDTDLIMKRKSDANFPSNAGTWIGLTDTITSNTYLWDDGSGNAQDWYTNYVTNEPDGNDDCVVMIFSGKWKNLNCGSSRRFACNNPQYIFVKNPKLNFSDASKYCYENYGRNLAYINSHDSNDLAYSLMINNNENSAWIGMKAEYVNIFGNEFWMHGWMNDGSSDIYDVNNYFGSIFDRWDSDEPDDTNGYECVTYDDTNNAISKSWNLDDCSVEKSFICDKVSY